MRDAARSSGKPLIVYVDEMACSAGYALACAAEAIVLPASGIVGSIGVLGTMVSFADALEKEGIRVAIVSSGKRKADGHPALPITDEAKARMQARVDEYARQFFALVAGSRPLTAANIKALEADCFVGQAAVDAKLADRLGTYADALSLARSRAAQTTVAVKAASPTSPTGDTMKTVLEALGLSEGASEAQALDAVKALKATTTDLLAITGAKTPDAAIGTTRGWAKTAEAYDAMVKERQAEQEAARKARVDAVFKAALEAGKRTPAQNEATKKSIAAGVLVLDTDAKIDAWEAEVMAGPVVIPGKDEKKPEAKTDAVGSKTWGEMTLTERAKLRREEPQAARALQKAHEEAQAKAGKPKG
jgi:ClpP class serine protease